jgi:hypothetical protein
MMSSYSKNIVLFDKKGDNYFPYSSSKKEMVEVLLATPCDFDRVEGGDVYLFFPAATVMRQKVLCLHIQTPLGSFHTRVK